MICASAALRTERIVTALRERSMEESDDRYGPFYVSG